MTPDLLRRCALAYSREAGTSGIAKELGVNASTVRRWLSGAVAIPESVPAELEKIMRRRAHEFRCMAATCAALAPHVRVIEPGQHMVDVRGPISR